MHEPGAQVTQLLSLARDGDSRATDALLPLVYEELRRMARAQLAKEQAGVTLQPTMLVHEAYLRLVGDEDVSWTSRGHFFGAAAQAMRRILVDRARTNNAAKRGGGWQRVELADQAFEREPGAEAMLQIDEALRQLEAYDAGKARIVMLRFFSGLTLEEIGRALDMTPTQVKTSWEFSRAWMYARIKQAGAATERSARAGSDPA